MKTAFALVIGSGVALSSSTAFAQCVAGPNHFCVTVGNKTAANPNPGGFPQCFFINGVESPEITLTRGETYAFQMVNTSPIHPFHIDLNREGGFQSELWSDGINPTSVTGNQTLTWVVAARTPDTLYYECFNHQRMGWRINIIDPPPPPCDADFNGDGFLDFFDADAYVSCFEGVECPPGKDADFNGDGFVDFFDLDAYIAAFEAGC